MRRHAHKQLFSSNAKNAVIKYQLFVLIKYKGHQQSPLWEELEPEVGKTLLKVDKQMNQNCVGPIYLPSLSLGFILCKMEIWVPQRVVIKVKWNNKTRMLNTGIDHSEHSHSCIFFQDGGKFRLGEDLNLSQVCQFHIRTQHFWIRAFAWMHFGNTMKAGTRQRGEGRKEGRKVEKRSDRRKEERRTGRWRKSVVLWCFYSALSSVSSISCESYSRLDSGVFWHIK